MLKPLLYISRFACAIGAQAVVTVLTSVQIREDRVCLSLFCFCFDQLLT